MRRIAFHTLGCRLNQAETAALAGRFHELGFEQCAGDGPAEVVVVHSCALTRSAELESLRVVRRMRKKHPGALIAFAGCATKVVDPAALAAEGAGLVIEQNAKATLPDRVAAALGIPTQPPGAHPALPRFATARAWIKVQDGCNFRCAYCIVPDARGAPRSRPLDDVLTEAGGLAERGYREIVLTGVNLGCYADGAQRLTDLVLALAGLPAISRIRLSSIEPGTMEREMADLACGEPKLCKTLHLPLQSGDPGVLRSMRRRYTIAEYESAVEHALERIPLLGLGADVITGFPGESEAAFEATRQVIERYPFSNLHVFPYSERPGTPAASLPGEVPVALRRKRASQLRELAEAKRRTFAARFLGKEVAVLIERVDAEGVGQGWTGEYVEASIAGLDATAVGTLRGAIPARLDGKVLASDPVL